MTSIKNYMAYKIQTGNRYHSTV